MKKLIIALGIVSSQVFADDVCTLPPTGNSHLPSCEGGRKLSIRSSIISCYDPQLGQSVWAASEMNPTSSHSYDRSTCDWKIDKNVDSIAPSVYSNTGFAKGHLIAFTDAPCQSSATDTCVTSNIIPQPMGQNSGIWLQLEKHIRGIATAQQNKKWLVIAGPRFPTTIAWIKPGLAQPNAIWKVLINTTDGVGCAYVGAFLKPYVVQTVSVSSLGITGVKDANPSICTMK